MQQFKSSITFKDITPDFLERYKRWMQDIEIDGAKLHANSIWKALATVRMFWHVAIKEQIIPESNNPFKVFKVGRYKRELKKIKYLKLAEIDAIETVLLSKPLDVVTLQVGWRFLFMCVSGLRISDARLLTDQFLKGDMIEFTPYKTRRSDNAAQVPMINERQQRYLQRTLSYPLPEKPLNDLRDLFNAELRLLVQLAGITQHVTSHFARHTMGSFLVDSSIDTKVAKQILGVKTDEVMNTYMHLKDSKILSEGKKLDGVF